MASKRSERDELSTTSTSLLCGLKCDQDSSWDSLIHTYGPVVYRRCRRSGLPVEEAEDVTQEVFAAVFRSIESFQPMAGNASFRKWLGTITTNKLRDYWRKRLSVPKATGGTSWHQLVQSLEDVRGDGGSTSLELAQKSEDPWTEVFHAVRAETSSRDWGIFNRVVIDEKPPADVAMEFEVSTNVVYLVRSRVLKKMRELVAASTI